MFNDFKGKAKRIEDIDLPRIGHRIGVGEDHLHAFMDVEAAGSGFDKSGRPKMLFEPHIFYKNLTGDNRRKAVAEGLAYSRWRKGNYPSDSYPRLKRAMLIDETAALKSASWGLGQILGINYSDVGYSSVQAMVKAFMDDEDEHLSAMVNFLIANNIDDDLRRAGSSASSWIPVVRVYNGPGYAEHNYHDRAAAAYRKWAKIPDTAWTPGLNDIRPNIPPKVDLKDPFVLQYQTDLKLLGFDPGKLDGVYGINTEKAVKDFQKSVGLRADGDVGPLTRKALDEELAKKSIIPDKPKDVNITDQTDFRDINTMVGDLDTNGGSGAARIVVFAAIVTIVVLLVIFGSKLL